MLRVYTNVQEMLALASFMSGAAMSDVTGHFREAYARYTTAAQAAREPKSLVRYATRTALLLAEYSRAHRQFTDAHLALMRAHFQVSTWCPILLLHCSWSIALACVRQICPLIPYIRSCKHSFRCTIIKLWGYAVQELAASRTLELQCSELCQHEQI